MPKKAMKYTVFISHSSEDKDIANEVAKKLKDSGIETFVDSASGRRSALGHVVSRMRKSDEVMVLVSDKSATKQWPSLDAGLAWGLGKTVTPLIHNIAIGKLPPTLKSKNLVRTDQFYKYQAKLQERLLEPELI